MFKGKGKSGGHQALQCVCSKQVWLWIKNLVLQHYWYTWNNIIEYDYNSIVQFSYYSTPFSTSTIILIVLDANSTIITTKEI